MYLYPVGFRNINAYSGISRIKIRLRERRKGVEQSLDTSEENRNRFMCVHVSGCGLTPIG
jgi:hypothetical protein